MFPTMIAFDSIRALIDTWPSRKEFAADVGVKVDRVQKWAQTGSIPARFHGRIIRAGALRGVVVTADDLVSLHDVSDMKDRAA